MNETRSGRSGDLARSAVQLLALGALLTTALTAVLFARSESAAHGAERFALRLAGEQRRKSARLAPQAIRAVALGVVVTAAIQSSLVGLGLFVVGAPFAAVLTALCFVLAVAQIGPLPIIDPARSRPSADADIQRGDQRPDCLRRDRALHRTGRARGGLHTSTRLDGCGRSGADIMSGSEAPRYDRFGIVPAKV